MSFAGNMAMGLLRFTSGFWNIEIADPEQYLVEAQRENAKHPFHRLKDHHALYKYYKAGGCPVILIRSKKAAHRKGKAILYLHGGITNNWEAELIVARGYANHTGMDVWYPVYPSVTEAAASDIVETVFKVYKKIIGKYGADNTALIGTSFGGTFGFGLICRINMENLNIKNDADRIPMPVLYIANSPGGVPQTDEDWAQMQRMSAFDPLINMSAVKNIISMQELIKEDIPMYANSPAYGNFANVPETYVYYATETLAGNHQAYERGYKDYGVDGKMHMHIQPGMMHGYSCLPVFKESRDAYNGQIGLLKRI